eukprot:COSAG02_NODE_65859_length_257_cov_0.588608_1_plen_32_part_10
MHNIVITAKSVPCEVLLVEFAEIVPMHCRPRV